MFVALSSDRWDILYSSILHSINDNIGLNDMFEFAYGFLSDVVGSTPSCESA